MEKTLPALMVVALILLAGCISGPVTNADTTPDPTTTTPTPTATPSEPSTDLLITVNNTTSLTSQSIVSNLEDGERPQAIEVVNNQTTPTTVNVSVTREGRPVIEDWYKLSADATVNGTLDYEANYTVTVTTDNHTATEHIDLSQFDCNGGQTTFKIEDDEITATTVSTMMYCPKDPEGDNE